MPEAQLVSEPTYRALAEKPNGHIDVNCGDGRRVVEGIPGAEDVYSKKFGGGPGYSWDVAVLRELYNPGSVAQTWDELHIELAPAFDAAGIDDGVHSDEHAEGASATAIRADQQDGKTGCGRLERADEIAAAYLAQVEAIIAKMQELAPDLIQGREDRVRQLAAINAELATRAYPDGRKFFPGGRAVMLAALGNGAKGLVLAGEHVEEDAWYNLRAGETNDNNASQKHFGADGWATQRFFQANAQTMQFDTADVLLQDIGISLATKLVLHGSLDDTHVRA